MAITLRKEGQCEAGAICTAYESVPSFLLPILHSTQREGEVASHLTAFVTLETGPVTRARLRGTDWRAAYPNTGGNMLSAEGREAIKDLIEAEFH